MLQSPFVRYCGHHNMLNCSQFVFACCFTYWPQFYFGSFVRLCPLESSEISFWSKKEPLRPIPFPLLFCPFNKSLLSLRFPGVRLLQRSRRVGVVSRFSTGQRGPQDHAFQHNSTPMPPTPGQPAVSKNFIKLGWRERRCQR